VTAALDLAIPTRDGNLLITDTDGELVLRANVPRPDQDPGRPPLRSPTARSEAAALTRRREQNGVGYSASLNGNGTMSVLS
jgi:hypothetical protein